jgi:hypothetical protein
MLGSTAAFPHFLVVFTLKSAKVINIAAQHFSNKGRKQGFFIYKKWANGGLYYEIFRPF